MNRKAKLGDALARKYTTEEKVEVEDPIKAIADSLKQEPIQESTPASKPTRTQESTQGGIHAGKPARTHARTQEVKQTSEETYIGKGISIDMLYDQIQQRKHLSNGSFRYRSDELEKMDAIFRELDEQKPGRISKNDLARMALVTLCHDFQENGEESILAQVFKRM